MDDIAIDRAISNGEARFDTRPEARSSATVRDVTIAIIALLAIWYALALGLEAIRGVSFPTPFDVASSLGALLMGEELYAASAYLSREPILTGCLKGQDAAKVILMVLVAAGVVLAAFGVDLGALLR